MNGYEKISDELKRQEKVNRLKSKILSDINKKIDVCKRELHSDATSDEDYSFWVYRYFYLLELKKYIENKYTFMCCTYECEDKDIRIYIINDLYLNIWLQDDYSFVDTFLYKLEFETKIECSYSNMYPYLNDNYFGYNFTDIVDEVLYKQKLQKNCPE